MKTKSLQGLYMDCINPESPLSSFDMALSQQLSTSAKTRQEKQETFNLPSDWQEQLSRPESFTELMRYFLQRFCLNDMAATPLTFSDEEASVVKSLNKSSVGEDFQLSKAVKGLFKFLIKEDFQAIEPQFLPSGAAPAGNGRYWPWASIPQPLWHAELGALWAILGFLMKDEGLLTAARKLGIWQMRATLDHRYMPSISLYSREFQSTMGELLCANIMLFHTVGLLCDEPKMEGLAQEQLNYLEVLWKNKHLPYYTYASLLMAWLDGLLSKKLDVSRASLSEHICDPHLALMGWRSVESHILCTGLGANTGMGSFTFKDVAIVNYGPQLLPLGDCRNFGIERTIRNHEENRTDLAFSSHDKGFLLKSKGRLTASQWDSEKVPCLERQASRAGIWFEAEQKYSDQSLALDFTVFSDEHIDGVAFVYFVKGLFCKVGDRELIAPQSLERYSGEVLVIEIEGTEGRLFIEYKQVEGDLQVIPLAAGNNFWGADFLLAYTLPKLYGTYKWSIYSYA